MQLNHNSKLFVFRFYISMLFNCFKRTTNNKELFCHQYWRKVLTHNKEIPNVSRFEFNDANIALMGFTHSNNLNSLIKDNDLAQKLLSKRIDNDIVLWRGISKPDTDNNKYNYAINLYKKCSTLRKGDTFYMPEYSFWSDNKNTALNYGNKNGILYELKVPKGTNIFQKIYPIFQRASKFLCTENNTIVNGNNKLNHIKLDLLPRDVK